MNEKYRRSLKNWLTGGRSCRNLADLGYIASRRGVRVSASISRTLENKVTPGIVVRADLSIPGGQGINIHEERLPGVKNLFGAEASESYKRAVERVDEARTYLKSINVEMTRDYSTARTMNNTKAVRY